MRGLVLALAAAASLTAIQPSFAGGGCGEGDNPMATSEGFGIAHCATRGRRYHIDDYAGEYVRGYVRHASADDPMAWSDDEWRTNLMSYTDVGDDRYDRRFHHVSAPVRIVRRAIRVYLAPPIEAAIRMAPAESLEFRTLMRGRGQHARTMGHACPNGGALVLHWTGYRAKASCVSSGPINRTPPKGVHVFPGRA